MANLWPSLAIEITDDPDEGPSIINVLDAAIIPVDGGALKFTCQNRIPKKKSRKNPAKTGRCFFAF